MPAAAASCGKLLRGNLVLNIRMHKPITHLQVLHTGMGVHHTGSSVTAPNQSLEALTTKAHTAYKTNVQNSLMAKADGAEVNFILWRSLERMEAEHRRCKIYGLSVSSYDGRTYVKELKQSRALIDRTLPVNPSSKMCCLL